jgi:hypothetical protein
MRWIRQQEEFSGWISPAVKSCPPPERTESFAEVKKQFCVLPDRNQLTTSNK